MSKLLCCLVELMSLDHIRKLLDEFGRIDGSNLFPRLPKKSWKGIVLAFFSMWLLLSDTQLCSSFFPSLSHLYLFHIMWQILTMFQLWDITEQITQRMHNF